MRRQEKLINESAEIENILKKGEIIRIAMVDDGEPYLVPMSYGFKPGVIYLHCAAEGRKVDTMRANPSVCFEVSVDTRLVKKTDKCGWTYHFRSVVGSGKAVFVEDFAEKLEGLSAVMEQYGSTEHSFPDAAVKKTTVIKIEIDEISGKRSPA